MSKDDDKERLRNFVFYKIYATNKEMEEAAPFIVIGVLVVLIVIGIGCLVFSK